MQADGKDVDSSKPQILLWEAKEFPDQFNLQYFFTQFAIQLNNLPDELKPKLPPTDSRLRPDQRALENGDLDQAAEEKNRLEEKQRALRKWREENPGNDFEAHYFKKVIDEDTGEEVYKYGEGRDYWADRKSASWDHLDDLF